MMERITKGEIQDVYKRQDEQRSVPGLDGLLLLFRPLGHTTASLLHDTLLYIIRRKKQSTQDALSLIHI